MFKYDCNYIIVWNVLRKEEGDSCYTGYTKSTGAPGYISNGMRHNWPTSTQNVVIVLFMAYMRDDKILMC